MLYFIQLLKKEVFKINSNGVVLYIRYIYFFDILYVKNAGVYKESSAPVGVRVLIFTV